MWTTMYLPGPDQFTSRVKKLNNFLIFPKVHIPHEGMVGLLMDFQALIGAGIFSVALSMRSEAFPVSVPLYPARYLLLARAQRAH